VYKIFWAFMLSLIALGMTIACDNKPQMSPAISALQQLPAAELGEGDNFNLSVAQTIGDGTWIPINQFYLMSRWDSFRKDPNNPGYSLLLEPGGADMPVKLLKVIDAFRLAHPELDIYEHHIEWQQDARGASSTCFGIYLFHRPASK